MPRKQTYLRELSLVLKGIEEVGGRPDDLDNSRDLLLKLGRQLGEIGNQRRNREKLFSVEVSPIINANEIDQIPGIDHVNTVVNWRYLNLNDPTPEKKKRIFLVPCISGGLNDLQLVKFLQKEYGLVISTPHYLLAILAKIPAEALPLEIRNMHLVTGGQSLMDNHNTKVGSLCLYKMDGKNILSYFPAARLYTSQCLIVAEDPNADL